MDITKREAQLCEALRGVPQNLTVDFIRYEIPPSFVGNIQDYKQPRLA